MATEGPQQKLDEWFLNLLACPGCVERRALTLNAEGTGLKCACGKYLFPVTDGIPVLLLESAEVLDAEKTAGDVSGADGENK